MNKTTEKTVEGGAVICSVCLKRFTMAEISSASACPACGTKSLPMKEGNDITVTLNIHQARCLTMWASRWAQEKFGKADVDSLRLLSNVIDVFRKQKPEVEWTMGDAFRSLRDKFGKIGHTGEEPIL